MSKMGNQSRIRKQFGAILDQKAGELIRFQAVQGDGTGTVKVPGKPNYIYIRRLGRNLCEECLNAKLPSRNDLPTIVGYTAANPGTLEVLGVDWSAVTEPGDYAYAPHHHQAHELGNEAGGDDVVWVQKQQVLPLLCRPTDPVSMFVTVLNDWYPWGSGWNYFEGATSADLTGYIPVLPGEARFVLISIDGATNALQYTSGTEFVIGLPLADIDERVPGPPLGSVPVCAVYIAGTTTSLDWENLYDLRLFNAPVGGSLMPGVHDHSSDAEGGLLPATSVEVEEIGAATYDDVQDWLNTTQSAGRLSGGAVTAHTYPITGVTVGGAGAGEFKVDEDHTAAFTAGIILTVSGSTNNDGDYTVSAGGATFAGGVTTIPVDEAVAAVADGNIAAGTVDVALGTGLIKVADAHLAATRFFDWAATTVPLIPTNNASNWIYVSYNAGSPIVGITDDRSIITRNDMFTIDRLWRTDSELHIIGKGLNAYNLSMRTHRNLVRMFHFQRGDGLMLTESGLRKVDVTAGNMYRGLNEIPTNHIDTDDGDSFTTLYRDGGGDWTWVTGQTTVDNVNYDDGTGVLEPLVNNQYGVYWVYFDYDSHLYVQYGQDSYRLGEAEVAQPPATAPFLSSFSMLIAKIIVQEGAAENFYSIQFPWDTVFVGAPVAVHNNLGGLQGGIAGEYYHLTAAEDAALLAAAANHFILVGDGVNLGGKAFSWADISAAVGAAMVHDHSTALKGGEVPLASLGGYTQGDLVYGGVVDWQDLIHPGVANRLLQSSAAEVVWSTNAVTFPTAGAVPVGSGANTQIAYWTAANILAGDAGLTYDAATDSLTIAGNILMADDKFIGITGDIRIEFDQSDGDIMFHLGDAAGADEVQVVDSGNVVVAYMDSDGNTYFAGTAGVGIAPSTTRLHVHESTVLGGTLGNAQILETTSGACGNTLSRSLWLYRDAAGANWVTTRLHDALSVDASFWTPHTNTRCWYERDPADGTHYWGDQATQYVLLSSAGMDISTRVAIGGSAALSLDRALNVMETYTNAAGQRWGAYVVNTSAPAANFSGNRYALWFESELSTAHTMTAGEIYGVAGRVFIRDGIAGVADLIGGWFEVDTEDGTSSTAEGLRIYTPFVDTGLVTSGFGLRLLQGTVGSGSITTLCGLYVSNMTAGNTNYAIYCAGGNSYHAGKVSIGGTVAPLAQLHVDQSSASGAIPVLLLDQADLSEEFIELKTTVGAGNPIDTAAIGTYYGKMRVNVTGVGYKYIALYNS